jgi:hypothetical protein
MPTTTKQPQQQPKMSTERLHSVYQRFLESQHDSRVANKVIQLLSNSEKNGRYIIDDRNQIVRNIAEDVEADGLSTKLMFASNSYLHDCLQLLLDEYLNYMDSIYYPAAPLPDFASLARRDVEASEIVVS